MQIARPHLPPSPGKDNRRPASPRHFWEGWRQYLLGHSASFCMPTQASRSVAVSTPCRPQAQLPKPGHCTEKGLNPGRGNGFFQEAAMGSGELSKANRGVSLRDVADMQAAGHRIRLALVLLIHRRISRQTRDGGLSCVWLGTGATCPHLAPAMNLPRGLPQGNKPLCV